MNNGILTFPNNLGAQDLYNVVRPPTVVIHSNVNALPNNHYVFANNTTTTSITLPANPIPGTVLWVSNVSSIFTHFCDRNGQRINGEEENLFMDIDFRVAMLRWIDPQTGWLVM